MNTENIPFPTHPSSCCAHLLPVSCPSSRHIYTSHDRHLESVGDFPEAIQEYERAKAHSYEVPRMMFDTNRMVELEEYINKSHNSKLLRWWGQYTESNR